MPRTTVSHINEATDDLPGWAPVSAKYADRLSQRFPVDGVRRLLFTLFSWEPVLMKTRFSRRRFLKATAAHAGFSDQSQFSRHFKRLIGVTPRHFRTPARNA
jgi:hypothetical protein